MNKIKNSKKILVSVIIPSFNGEKYLREAIQSILDQSFKDYELIIIDDASSDNTRDIINEFAAKDSRIKYFQNSINLGFAENRNKALQLASGEFIVWQDQDDVSCKSRIAKQLNVMISDQSIGAIGGFMEVFDSKGSYGIRTYPETDIEIRKMIFKFSPIALPASMIRKSAILEVGGYDKKSSPAADLDMTFKIGSKYRLANIQNVVVRYRKHDQSGTLKKLKQIEVDTLKIRYKYSNSIHFRPSMSDYIYNFLHLISVWIVPPKIKIILFNLIRTKKVSI